MREEQDSGIGYALIVFTIRAIFVVGWLKLPIAQPFTRGGTLCTALSLQSSTLDNFFSSLPKDGTLEAVPSYSTLTSKQYCEQFFLGLVGWLKLPMASLCGARPNL